MASVQNRFISTECFFLGINGCMKHIFAIQQILSNAKDHNHSLSLSFVDLKSAFGSTSHQYIFDMLNHIKVPTEIQLYIKSLYSSLTGFVCTKDWMSTTFSIRKGVFQGDTLSHLLFLIIFNLIIQSIASHPVRGFSLTLEYEGQERPPPMPVRKLYLRPMG